MCVFPPLLIFSDFSSFCSVQSLQHHKMPRIMPKLNAWRRFVNFSLFFRCRSALIFDYVAFNFHHFTFSPTFHIISPLLVIFKRQKSKKTEESKQSENPVKITTEYQTLIPASQTAKNPEKKTTAKTKT